LAFGELSDPLTITAIVVAVVIVAVVIVTIYSMRRLTKKNKQPQKSERTVTEPELGLPFRVNKSIQTNDASHARDELRMLDLERDILSDAIRRLYEAHAEGKITEEERERLAGTYKARMTTVKNAISKDETIVALHELEGMQEDLMKLFSERFGELSSKVDELRSKIDVRPLKEVKVQLPTTQPVQMEAEEVEVEEGEEEEETEKEEGEAGKEKPKRKRKAPSERQRSKTEAEQRIDEIRSEVEKVLDRLGQMEVES
jgi:uncharacterized membrane protein